ncbi:MAG: ABC transporter permease [Candidatus Omnitrophica bacterium]|nr:ABC transporter permease [Candidatus Omnitrophota bacterium]
MKTATEKTAAIEIKNIAHSYIMGEHELKVLKGVSLKIEEGEFVAIVGHSGSGKSTLMQIMGLLDRPTSGQYFLLGRDVSCLSDDEGAVLRSKTIGFVFQAFNLLARTSALDNVILPMVYSGQKHRGERGQELLREMGLEGRTQHKPNELSGGEQQRVAIARALVNKPRIILADEPTGNVDSRQADEILHRLVNLNKQGITVIIVTHETSIAAYTRRIIRLKDGVIIEDVPNIPIQVDRKEQIPVSVLAVPSTIAISPAVKLEHPELNMAELKEHIITSLRAMAANKVRSFLSMLGVLIGVAGVIAVMAVGAGAQKSIQARIASLGSNVIMLFPGAPNMRGVQGAVGDYSRLTLDDVKAVRNASLNIVDIYGEAEANVRVVYQDKNTIAELQGVPISYESIRSAKPENGRFFTEDEDVSRSRVVLLGQTVVNNLFGDENPVGKIVKINKENFNVVGILPVKGFSGGFSDQDNMVVVPLQTAMKRVLNTTYLHEMAIQCDSSESIQPVIDDIEAMLRKRHHLASGKENDFTLRNNAQMQATLSETTKTLSTLLGTVAIISLLVGGVSIMNIMLVSVNERTREIGLRKAVGAPRRAILIQFLMESSLLCVLGGMMGILLGILVSFTISQLAGWVTSVTIQSIVLAFAFSVGIGIVFGFWPAYTASLLSPIKALRYE